MAEVTPQDTKGKIAIPSFQAFLLDQVDLGHLEGPIGKHLHHIAEILNGKVKIDGFRNRCTLCSSVNM